MGEIQQSTQRVEPIDGLRGLAALAVAWFHLYGQNGGTPLSDSMPHFLNWASVWGRFGVQLFFVISGFVVAYTLLPNRGIREARDVGVYFVRRSVRLDPTYWLALLVYLLLVPVLIRLGAPADLYPPQQLNLREIAANILYFVPALPSHLYVPVAWSLIIEIQFYVFFAVIVLLVNRLSGQSRRDEIFCWFGLLIVLAAAVPMFRLSIPYPTLYDYLFQFLGGIFAAAVYLGIPRAIYLWVLHVALMLAAIVLFRNSYVLASLTATFLVAVALTFPPLRRLLGSPVMLYLGALSYCIYLFHPLIGGLAIESLQTVFGREPGPHQLAILIMGMLAVAAVSAAVYKWVEAPSILLSKRIARRMRRAEISTPQISAAAAGDTARLSQPLPE